MQSTSTHSVSACQVLLMVSSFPPSLSLSHQVLSDVTGEEFEIVMEMLSKLQFLLKGMTAYIVCDTTFFFSSSSLSPSSSSFPLSFTTFSPSLPPSLPPSVEGAQEVMDVIIQQAVLLAIPPSVLYICLLLLTG